MILLLAACYTPPDLPVTPYEAPILASDEGDAWHICAVEKPIRVDCVIDGDTFDFDGCGTGGERVRLLGIDAPEVAHGDEPADCYGDAAANELDRILARRSVRLAYDRYCLDVFGERTLGYVWMDMDDAVNVLDRNLLTDLRVIEASPTDDDGRILLNEYLLLAGWVRRYDEEWVEPLRWDNELVAAERTAQLRNNRLWGVCE